MLNDQCYIDDDIKKCPANQEAIRAPEQALIKSYLNLNKPDFASASRGLDINRNHEEAKIVGGQRVHYGPTVKLIDMKSPCSKNLAARKAKQVGDAQEMLTLFNAKSGNGAN